MPPPTVFVSYSRKDENEKNQLLAHLNVLQGAGLVDVWSDDRISGGADWEQEIHETMAQAKVAILLISVNFLNSDFILKKEVPDLLERRKNEDLAVFPVIAKSCAWKRITWLTKMNVRPRNGRPVWRQGGIHADDELAAIADEVADIIEKMSLISNELPDHLSAEAKNALDACFEQSYQQILDTLAGPRRKTAKTRLDAFRQAFLLDPLNLKTIETTLASFNDTPTTLRQIRLLLQEPTLQRLARRGGEQATQRYERLAFEGD